VDPRGQRCLRGGREAENERDRERRNERTARAKNQAETHTENIGPVADTLE